MADFYDEAIATAQDLITEFGRSITLQKYNETEDEAGKPWKRASDPTASPAGTLTVDAAAVPISSASDLGFMITAEEVQRSSQVYLFSPGAAVNMSGYSRVSDGGDYAITFIKALKPGSKLVLVAVGVKQ